jgi:predicted membrane-bound dolichyl-phosphate-mannose-protein mannosyltransferase
MDQLRSRSTACDSQGHVAFFIFLFIYYSNGALTTDSMAHSINIALAHYMAHSGALLSILQWRTRWFKEVRHCYAP